MLRAPWSTRGRRHEVDDGEDEDPDHVDEMPVEADDLDGLGILLLERAPVRRDDQRHQHHDADADVDAVEAGQREERRRERAGRIAQALPEEGRELVDLAADEQRSQKGRGQEPDPVVANVAPLYGRQCQHHCERAHEEHERTDRCERDVEDVAGRRTGVETAPVDEVGRYQATEQQALRAQEGPHQELVVGDARRRVVHGVRFATQRNPPPVQQGNRRREHPRRGFRHRLRRGRGRRARRGRPAARTPRRRSKRGPRACPARRSRGCRAGRGR